MGYGNQTTEIPYTQEDFSLGAILVAPGVLISSTH